ncbi:hypothetical protein GCM10010394_65670 [Streptomyces crystallinus]|uniref:Uncharacterized protein n=1 Tax=Streptomyces crystallinus TaxID=68191 RepID=A0ABN1H0X5_9ACTN
MVAGTPALWVAFWSPRTASIAPGTSVAGLGIRASMTVLLAATRCVAWAPTVMELTKPDTEV